MNRISMMFLTKMGTSTIFPSEEAAGGHGAVHIAAGGRCQRPLRYHSPTGGAFGLSVVERC